MPVTEDKIKNYLRFQHLNCQFLLDSEESSKVWQAVQEAAELIDYLNLCMEFQQFQGDTGDDHSGLVGAMENARDLFDQACDTMYTFLEPGAKLDPIIQRYRQDAVVALTFRKDLYAIPIDHRSQCIGQMLRRFKTCIPDTHKFAEFLARLDKSEKEACEELEVHSDLQQDHIPTLMQRLSFCNRRPLYRLGVFRIRQDLRHRVFADAKPLNAKVVARIYLTPALDAYLFERDLRLNVLRSWGRFIPLGYNHMLIKYYSEPVYWDNRHMTLGPDDHLRLGFAHYQYAMEMSRDSDFSRMHYRKALNGFKKSGMRMPTDLRIKLWGR